MCLIIKKQYKHSITTPRIANKAIKVYKLLEIDRPNIFYSPIRRE